MLGITEAGREQAHIASREGGARHGGREATVTESGRTVHGGREATVTRMGATQTTTATTLLLSPQPPLLICPLSSVSELGEGRL